MKRSVICCLALVAALAGCKNNTAPKPPSSELSQGPAIMDTAKLFAGLPGTYIGDLGDNRINILISEASSNHVEGQSITNGNARPFTGKIEKNNERYYITADEPGTDKTGGRFRFIIDPAVPGSLAGSWEPFKNDPAIPKKEFSVSKRTFTYAKDSGIYPQASTRILTDDDVNNLLKPELVYMRNEIFARHGYYFTDATTMSMFKGASWYTPMFTDVNKDLTKTEIRNIAIIKRYEKYAQQYGTDFGR